MKNLLLCFALLLVLAACSCKKEEPAKIKMDDSIPLMITPPHIVNPPLKLDTSEISTEKNP